MAKNMVVIFSETNARLVKDVSDEQLEKFKGASNVAINPHLKGLGHNPPKFWKLVDGQVHPMTPAEQAERLKKIKEVGPEKDPTPTILQSVIKKDPILHEVNFKKEKDFTRLEAAYFFVGGVLFGTVFGLVLHMLPMIGRMHK